MRGTAGVGSAGYRYTLTDLGRERAGQFMDLCRYVGPAPVPLAQYNAYVRACMSARPYLNRDLLSRGFEHLVVNQAMFDKLGPAVNSGKALFLYGKPGNGKTVFAEGIGRGGASKPHRKKHEDTRKKDPVADGMARHGAFDSRAEQRPALVPHGWGSAKARDSKGAPGSGLGRGEKRVAMAQPVIGRKPEPFLQRQG